MSLVPDRDTSEQLRLACDAVNGGLRRRRVWLAWVGLAGSLLVAATWWRAPELAPPAAFVAVALLAATAHFVRSAAGREFKRLLATTIVPLMRPGLVFDPLGSIGVGEFNALRLFTSRADRVAAQDELRGERNGVSYAVEELHATYTTTTTTGKSVQRRTHTIFRGAAVRLEFNKHFHGHTVVVPRSFGAGWLSDLFGGSLDSVALENPRFQEAFLTRATDQQEARYLLTPRFMELVLHARTRLGSDFRMAFQGDTLHVLVAGTPNRFEVSFFRGVSPSRTVAELEAVIALAEQLVETLELETRIWTRR